nr:aromatic-ring-hydroxylating oxygenase beta subunit [uncultured bacterium]
MKAVATELYLKMQQRLYEEARVLDEERFGDWLDMLSDDVRYVMPMPERCYRKDHTEQSNAQWQAYIFDDNKDVLKMRIARLESGFVWCEDPRNVIRHLVHNVEVYRAPEPDTLCVHSLVEIHRNRLDGEQRRLLATRVDHWRATDDDYLLARREGVFCHAIVADSNLNLFF